MGGFGIKAAEFRDWKLNPDVGGDVEVDGMVPRKEDEAYAYEDEDEADEDADDAEGGRGGGGGGERGG